jgi:UDP:flavonoid glycosyltransferase YjiC (YdhE family)
MGAGHCVNLLPLAERLLARGHKVFVAARDLAVARHVFGSLPVHYLAAGFTSSRPSNAVAMPRTFAHILHNTGFGEWETLEAMTAAWRNLLDLVQPDVVVCEHAPMALLASHASGRRHVVIGTGFFSPPDIAPLPDLRDWLPPMPAELYESEMAVLNRVNRVLTSAGKLPLPRLSSLYADVDANFLLTFRELDHYPQRPQSEYWGMWSPGGGHTLTWPASTMPKVFAYLKPPLPVWKLADVLTLLRQSPITAAVYVAGMDPAWLRQFQSPNMLTFAEPLDIRGIARDCDFAILNGNAGTATDLLLRGVPQLHIPIYLEQATFSRRITSLGAGIMAESNRLDQIADGLQRLMASSSYREAAQQFAQRYAEFDAERSVNAIIDRILLLAQSAK